MNKVNLIGRLTADVVTKTYGKGKKSGTLANFCIAVQRDRETADFIYCTAFNGVAEFLEEYSSGKGARIAVDGSLQQSTYDKDGTQRTMYNVLVNSVDIIDWAEKEEKRGGKR